MHEFDETDLEILRLLVENGRRPYSDIAEVVGLSPPAVRDRIDRLQEAGVIHRFTVDIDRGALQEGVPVLVSLEPSPARLDEVTTAIKSINGVEHVFITADARIVFHALVPGGDVRGLLANAVDFDALRSLEVSLLSGVEWLPRLDGTAFAIECAECGNTVTAEGESARIDGSLYHFCCPSCAAQFEDRYAELESSI